MQIAIMQPTYLPWIGYFDLIDRSDIFVFLDSVQFERRSWQQRNRVKSQGELQWLSVPVLKSGRYGQNINEVEIVRSSSFPRRHLRAIEHSYRRAPFFDKYYPSLQSILEQDGRLLNDLNQRLVRWLSDSFGLQTRFAFSSGLRADGKRSELLANICRELGATTYLSALGSAEYILTEAGSFEQHGITVLFQHYEHPAYRQLQEPFLPFASSLDLLFNEGERSLEILRSGRRPFYSMNDVRHIAEPQCPGVPL